MKFKKASQSPRLAIFDNCSRFAVLPPFSWLLHLPVEFTNSAVQCTLLLCILSDCVWVNSFICTVVLLAFYYNAVY